MGSLLAAVAVMQASAAMASPQPFAPSVRLALRAKATLLASSAGDAHPSLIEAVYTTERRYLRAENPPGGGSSQIASQTPVYLLVIRGHFVCRRCSAPGLQTKSGSITVLSTALLADGLAPSNAITYRTTFPSLRFAGTPVKL